MQQLLEIFMNLDTTQLQFTPDIINSSLTARFDEIDNLILVVFSAMFILYHLVNSLQLSVNCKLNCLNNFYLKLTIKGLGDLIKKLNRGIGITGLETGDG